MKKIYISITYLFILFTLLNAQKAWKETDATITGDVQCEGKHLPFMNVTIDGTTIGTVTDATGHFILTNLPVGDFTLRVSGVGYKTKTKEVSTSANYTTTVKFHVEEDILNLEGVVVSADRNQTNRAEAPTIVTSIQPKIFEQTQSVNIADGLNYTPGLRTEATCQNCGFVQLRMNGLDGPYTQILMNSRPVFSGLAGVYGLELIPTSMVERLEVVRGGGSSLFGGNAIAGTVNIITKEPKRNSFDVEGRYSMAGLNNEHFNDVSTDQQINANGSVVTSDGKSGAYIYSMLRDRDAYDDNGDGFSEEVMLENTTFGFSAFHKPTSKGKITLDGYRINEFRRGGNKMDLLPHEADIAEQVRHKITGANLAYDLFTNNNYNKLTLYAASQSVNRESYYGAQQDPNAYGHTEDFTGSFGAQYVLNVDEFLFAPSSTIFGLDNNFNRLKDEKMGVDGPNTEISNQLVNTFGSFIQHDWKSDNVNVSLGARFDNYLIRDLNSVIEDRAEDISELVVAPRLSAMYKISKDLRFRASYAKGYRAPQVFNEDLHIEMVNARRVIHINSEDLTRETSHSITSSVNYSFGKGEFVSDILIEGFYTKLQDAFADDHFEIDSSGTWGYKRVNAENGAHVAGINFEYNGSLVKRLDFQAGFTLQQSQFEDAQQWGDQPESKTKDFVRSPDQYGFVTLSWYPFEKFQTTLSMNYTGPMHVPHFGGESTSMADLQKMQNHIHELEQSIINASSISQINELESKLGEQKAKYQNAKLINKAIEDEDIIEGEKLEISKEFFALDLMFSYKLQLSRETNLSIYAGIKNLLNQTQNDHDRGVFRDAGYIYGPCQPRMLNFGLKFSNVFH